MLSSNVLTIFLFLSAAEFVNADEGKGNNVNDLFEEPATVLIAILVRNKAHTLPYFLSYVERLNYPKDRVSLWIRSDHNEDKSVEILQLWLNRTKTLYHHVDFRFDNDKRSHENETSPYDWPSTRFSHLIKLKEQALTHAQKIWADYIFYLDADVLLTSSNTLSHLTNLRLPIVAPMLLSEGLYSNFWCGMTDDYYYQRTEEYKEIYEVHKEGNFRVPMVHSAVLIYLKNVVSRYLTFDRERLIEQQVNDAEWAAAEGRLCRVYNGPLDDIIIFAISANCSQIPMFISNDIPYGYILQPLETYDTLEQDLQQLVNIKTNIIHDLGVAVEVHESFAPYVHHLEKQTLTLDKIYMINLERRPERRRKMELLFDELGLNVEYFSAIDGKTLSLEVIQNMGIKFLEGYEDPYHHRQMTMGEVGCFLSHYSIWQEIVEKGLKEVLVLEDDIRFEPYFNERAVKILDQARKVVEYDLIYFGRKRLKDESEPWVMGSENLVHVGYSYWTLGYVISQTGARKLLNAKPLEKLIPVDEYLPLMFNRHPNKTWIAAFPERNLIAFSAAPLVVFPTHYTGDIGYISDTEDSELTPQKEVHVEAMKTTARLKSDREQEFDFAENLDEKLSSSSGNSQNLEGILTELHLDDPQKFIKNELNSAKQHEEL